MQNDIAETDLYAGLRRAEAAHAADFGSTSHGSAPQTYRMIAQVIAVSVSEARMVRMAVSFDVARS